LIIIAEGEISTLSKVSHGLLGVRVAAVGDLLSLMFAVSMGERMVADL
jgi:hypothetical protein